MASVEIYPIPPAQPEPAITAPLAALAHYAVSHHHALLAAAWLEAARKLAELCW